MLALIIDALATYRLTKLVVDDEILSEPRIALIERWGEDSKLSYLIQCPWCVSPYVAILVLCLNLTAPGRFVVRVLALSAVAGLISENA